MGSKPRNCRERIGEHHADRRKDFLRYFNAQASDASDEFKQRHEDNTEPLAITAQISIRIDLSTGGPGDWYEITFDQDGTPLSGVYHFNDWFDHASEPMENDELDAVLARFALDDPYLVREFMRAES